MTEKMKIVECEHNERMFFQFRAGPHLTIRLCEMCYSFLYREMSKEILQHILTGIVTDKMKKINEEGRV